MAPNIEQLSAPELAERLKCAAAPKGPRKGPEGPEPLRVPLLVIVDVREPWEVELSGFPGAIAIPLGELTRQCENLDPDTETVLICHHGYRSMQACMFLSSRGFERLVNLRGGIEAWSALVDPTVPRY